MPSSSPHAAPARNPTPNLRERFDAMRNLGPFLRQIWQTSRVLTLASLGLRLLRAFVPVVTLYIAKLIIDEAIRLVGLGLTSVRWSMRGAAGSSTRWRRCWRWSSRWPSVPTCLVGW